jgi:hypothetical protein
VPSKTISQGLDGGFRPSEGLKRYDGAGLSVYERRGQITKTGDFYVYTRNRGDVAISPVEVPFSVDTASMPRRVKVAGSCSTDQITDNTTCRLNILPQLGGFGSLYQIVSASGSILSSCVVGHDFPGRTAAIRVDDNPAIVTNTEGCVSGATARRLERQLLGGKRLITRRVEWPYESMRDEVMLIEGSFSSAQELFRWSVTTDLKSLFEVRS